MFFFLCGGKENLWKLPNIQDKYFEVWTYEYVMYLLGKSLLWFVAKTAWNVIVEVRLILQNAKYSM